MHLRPRRVPAAPQPSVRRRAYTLLTATACLLSLSACTAHLDMVISAQGTYDVTMEMRDTTGSVLTADTDCSQLADPSLVGAAEGASVTASPIGSADDEGGVGCVVTVSGVAVPKAEDLGPSGSALVVRDGDLDVVDLGTLMAAAGLSGLAEAATGAPSATPTNTQTGNPASTSATAPATDALASSVDVRVSVTFPGAVVEDGGGTVSGRTVTWTDTDQILAGVSASGYAVQDQGLSFWDRWGWWLVGAVAGLGLLAGGTGLLRRRC